MPSFPEDLLTQENFSNNLSNLLSTVPSTDDTGNILINPV